MVNYANGKVYKIEPINAEEGDVYIGSTTKPYLCQRMAGHKYHYNKWKTGEMHPLTLFRIFEKYGIDNCNIYLLENVDAKSKDELAAREGYFIRTMDCVNRMVAGRTDREYREDNKIHLKEQKRQYYIDNEVKLNDYKRKWYEANKHQVNERRRKEYALTHNL